MVTEAIAKKALAILSERTPPAEQLITNLSVAFLDPMGLLSREERGKVVAMGDRTAISYQELSQKVLSERDKPPTEVDGELVSATAAFFLAYTLAARSSKEISHTSIQEQLNAGPFPFGGDPPIVLEGISALSGLRDLGSLRFNAYEIQSSRGAVFPIEHAVLPDDLTSLSIGSELVALNADLYPIYHYLTLKGLEHHLSTIVRQEGEKPWQFNWRALNLALDDSRQVTNHAWKIHLSMHPNSALALREDISLLGASELPETREVAEQLRLLAVAGLPTLIRYTEPSPYNTGLSDKRDTIAATIGIRSIDKSNANREGKSRLINAQVTANAEQVFLAAFLADGGDHTYAEALEETSQMKEAQLGKLVEDTIGIGLSLHDKSPKALEFIQVVAQMELSTGAIWELVRHRLATFLVGRLNPYRGYAMPKIYEDLNLVKEYQEAMYLNRRGFAAISSLSANFERALGPYFVSRADLVPVTMRIDGVSIFHLLKLRASAGAHPDIYEPAKDIVDQLRINNFPIFRHLQVK